MVISCLTMCLHYEKISDIFKLNSAKYNFVCKGKVGLRSSFFKAIYMKQFKSFYVSQMFAIW